MAVQNVKDLIVYQKAYDLAMRIFTFRRFTPGESLR